MQNNANISNDRQRMMLNKLMDNFEGNLTSSKWAKIIVSGAALQFTDNAVRAFCL